MTATARRPLSARQEQRMLTAWLRSDPRSPFPVRIVNRVPPVPPRCDWPPDATDAYISVTSDGWARLCFEYGP